MNRSDDIKELAGALSKAQAEIRGAEMNKKNPHLNSSYADLGSVIEACREPLAKNGLAISQMVSSEGDNISLETMLMHSSGQWISERLGLPFISDNRGTSLAQKAGAVITYMRRYALSAMLGIYADEDTDGTQAKQEQRKPVSNNGTKPEPAVKLTLAEAVKITNSEGKEYGTLDDKTLDGMSIGIRKGLQKKDITQDERNTYLRKQAAIQMIKDSRQQAAQVQPEMDFPLDDIPFDDEPAASSS